MALSRGKNSSILYYANKCAQCVVTYVSEGEKGRGESVSPAFLAPRSISGEDARNNRDLALLFAGKSAVFFLRKIGLERARCGEERRKRACF